MRAIPIGTQTVLPTWTSSVNDELLINWAALIGKSRRHCCSLRLAGHQKMRAWFQ
jgi:hypothetical protein